MTASEEANLVALPAISSRRSMRRGTVKPRRRERRPTAKQTLALLSDPRFRADVEALRVTTGTGDSGEDAVRDAEQERERKRAAFKDTWGPIVPPPAGALLEPDPRRSEADALLSGRWGLVRVFPWTTESDAKKEFRRIRDVIRRAQRERRNAGREERARWLTDCGFSSPEIAVAVWGRTKGLKPSQNLSEADRLLARALKADEEYQAAKRRVETARAAGRQDPAAAEVYGARYRAAHRKAIAAAAEREAPAGAAVRTARSRHQAGVRRQRQEFQAPLAVDPLSACIMNIIRLKFWPAWPLPLPWVAPIGAIAERLDPLLDELRRQLLEGPSA